MASKLVKSILGVFGGITGSLFGKYALIFIISLMPILELRGGLIAASLLDIEPLWACQHTHHPVRAFLDRGCAGILDEI